MIAIFVFLVSNFTFIGVLILKSNELTHSNDRIFIKQTTTLDLTHLGSFDKLVKFGQLNKFA